MGSNRKTYKSKNVVPKAPKPAPRDSKRIDGRKSHHDGKGQSGQQGRR